MIFFSKKMKIVLLGTGNVAHHLAHRFQAVGLSLAQLYGRNLEKLTFLANALQCPFTNNPQALQLDADLYILAVSDGAIEILLQEIEINAKGAFHKALFVHTSGTIPSTVFAPFAKHYGVFYPLQTFSIGKQPDWSNLPMCVDANTDQQLIVLEYLARQLSPNVHRITDAQRATLHVAAVFVNNFTNHLFHIGQTIVENEGISFDLLKPLIQETAAKIQHNSPQTMQTGPAKRGDTVTIEKHKTFLKKYPFYNKLYDLMTKNINDKKNHLFALKK